MRDLLARTAGSAEAAAGARQLRLNIEDEISGARRSACARARGERQHDAMVQFWLPSANALVPDRGGRGAFAAHRRSLVPAGWWRNRRSSRTRPIRPLRALADGWLGANRFPRPVPDRLSHAEWRSLWQDQHTRVAIETQANFEYVQNLIVHQIAPDCAALLPPLSRSAFLKPRWLIRSRSSMRSAIRQGSRSILDRMMESCDASSTAGLSTSSRPGSTRSDWAQLAQTGSLRAIIVVHLRRIMSI
jgi:hypothetical protein